MKEKKVVSAKRVAREYMSRACHNFGMSELYSWRRWGHYNKLRLLRAHLYLERLSEALTISTRWFTPREVAQLFGAGSVSEAPSEEQRRLLIDEYNEMIGDMGRNQWGKHLISVPKNAVLADEFPF